MAGAERGQGARRRRRKRMGKRQEVEEEEEDWRRRRREWRQRMGMGWREQKGEEEGIRALFRNPRKAWGPCCRGRWRGWRSGDRVVEVDEWGPLVLWCLICRPSGMREEHASANKKITAQQTRYWCLSGYNNGSQALHCKKLLICTYNKVWFNSKVAWKNQLV